MNKFYKFKKKFNEALFVELLVRIALKIQLTAMIKFTCWIYP